MPTSGYRAGIELITFSHITTYKVFPKFEFERATKIFCATLMPFRFSLLYTYAACLAIIISILAVKRLVEVILLIS